MATQAVIRSGDYPRGDRSLEVTVILSELVNSKKVVSYFNKTINYLAMAKRRRGGLEFEQKDIEEAFRDIPSLL